MPDRVPGQTCQTTKPVNVQDGGTALAATPKCGPTGGSIWNLPGAKETLAPEFGACYPPVVTTLCLTSEEMQILSALRSQRANIIAAEQNFRVDRRAIAGAIAWEMMVDPMIKFRKYDPLPFRGMGWGQVHRYNIRKKEAPGRIIRGIITNNPGPILGIFDFDTMAKQVEAAGYLPKRTNEERFRICSSPEGSITYVGGIMAAIAEAPEIMGFEEDVRSSPAILTNVYHGMTLKDWKAHLTDKMAKEGNDAVFEAGTEMGVWVGKNLDFLEEAVGCPDLPESAPGFSSMPSGNSVVVQKGWTLSGIAKAEYGDEELWPLIYDVNKTKIGGNPNLIQPGMILSIRPLTQFSADEIAEAKKRAPTWKNFK